MLFGSVFLGKVKELDKQFIETKFVLIGVPLYPANSIFVTHSDYNKRSGFDCIPFKQSILAGYLRIFSFLIGLGLLFAGAISMSGLENEDSNDLYFVIIGIILLLLWAYSFFIFGKPKDDEILRRKRLGNAIGVNALPEWLTNESVIKMIKDIEYKIFKITNDPKWKDSVENFHRIPKELVPILFAYYSYKCDYEVNLFGEINSKTLQMFEKVDSQYGFGTFDFTSPVQ